MHQQIHRRVARAVVCLLAAFAAPAAAAEDSQYALRPNAVGAPAGMGHAVRADNAAQGFIAWIGGEGLLVRGGGGSNATAGPAAGGFEITLELQRFGRGETLAPVAAACVETRGPRAELHRGALVEWYENRPEGLEQGFTLAERPQGDGAEVVIELALRTGDLVARVAPDRRSLSFLRSGTPLAQLEYRGLTVVDASSRSLPAWLETRAGEEGQYLRVHFDDQGAAYPVRVDPLVASAAWSSDYWDSTLGIALGDWDGDGDLDLATGGLVGGGVPGPVRVYANQGGSLTLAWVAPESGYWTSSLAWGDWDGDGDLDLAAGSNRSSEPNRVYRNDLNAGGTLALAWTSTEPDRTYSVAWGDWDGDGDLDLATGNRGEPNRVYRNDGGTLTTEAAWSSAESEQTFSVAWGDWDGDGDLDLAVGNQAQPNRVYENDNGTLTSAWESAAPHDETFSVAWGDWDGDGDLDLAAGSPTASRVYDNDLNEDGTRTLTSAWESAGPCYGTRSVAWGDWDGDGDLDLATGNYGYPKSVYRNDGGGLAVEAAWLSADVSETRSVAWGDWDGDGDLDLAAGNDESPEQIYRNDGGSLISTWTSAAPHDATFSVAWGDWDGDDDLDLAAGNGNDHPLRVYGNDGGMLTVGPVWSSAESDSTTSVAWGDWDGDGDLDLAAGHYAPFKRVYRNEGGTLTSVWTSVDSDPTNSVAWGDWDGDGDLDLAAGNSGQNRIYQNDGDTLISAWQSDDDRVTYSVAWGDWDGDGDLDLAAGNYGQPNRVYQNDGGTLTAAWDSAESEWTTSVAWGDWDGDGDLDLAVGNNGQANRVYRNDLNEGSTLTSAWESAAPHDYTQSVAWGDWDGDGDLDLAAGNFAGPNRVYRNDNGMLTTTEAWSSMDDDWTYSVAWGDWDADGDLDLAAGNMTGGSGQPNRVYRNGWLARPGGLPETPVSAVVARRPGVTPAAAGYSYTECLRSPVVLDYRLVDEEFDRARRVRFEYAFGSAGPWLPASEAPGGTGTEDLAANPSGLLHHFLWDSFADGVARAPEVYLRVVVPFQASTRLAGPIQRGAMRTVSPPFAVCDPAADLALTLEDGVATAAPGTPITYTLTVENAGPDDASGVRVVGSFPAALGGVTWTCDTQGGGGTCDTASGAGDIDVLVDLPADGAVVFSATGVVDAAATGLLTATATATLPPDLATLDATDDTATDTDALVPSTDLSITNSNGVTTAVPGEAVTYMIAVSNAGPSVAWGAQVVDLFAPALTGVTWTCAGSGGGACAAAGAGAISEEVDLPVGAAVVFIATGTLDPAATGTLVTAATVLPSFSAITGFAPTATDGDPSPGDNTAVDVDLMTPEADLEVTKSDGMSHAMRGAPLTYTVTVGNPGPSSVVGVTVNDVLPAELEDATWICVASGGAACEAASGSGDLGETVDLPAGSSLTFTVDAVVSLAAAGPTLTNTASATVPAGVTEGEPGDNSATDTDLLGDPMIFSDGFESGGTGAWDFVQPGGFFGAGELRLDDGDAHPGGQR